MRITVYGRGAHGSMPQAAVDPVVLAAMIVIRLQTIVAREVAPGESAVLTVGSIHAGSKSNVIPDRAELQLNIRTYSEPTRTTMLDAIERIVTRRMPGLRIAQRTRIRAFRPLPVDGQRPRVRPSRRRSQRFSGTVPAAANADCKRRLQRHPDRPRRALHLLGHRRHRPCRLPGRRRRAESTKTSRSITPPPSPPSSSPPSTPAPRLWSSPRWHGCTATEPRERTTANTKVRP